MHSSKSHRAGKPLVEVSAIPRKEKGAELHGQYALVLQASLVVVLLGAIGMVRLPLHATSNFEIVMPEQEVVKMEDIQQTQQREMPPPPPKPQVPVAVSDEEVLDDVDLDLDAALDLDAPVSLPETPPPPPPPAESAKEESAEPEIFAVVEEMPEIIGGTKALYDLIEYPELARQAGIEGLVVVQVVVEPDGTPSHPKVVRSAGDILDKAAIEAVMKLKFKPGKQRSRPVRVQFAVPVRFRLRDTK